MHLAIADPFNNGGRNEIAISRGADRAPLSLTVIPLRHHVEWIARQEQAAIVFVSDPEDAAGRRHQVLQKQFGLTRAEAALVEEMLKGGDMPEVAARLGIAPATRANAPASHLQEDGHDAPVGAGASGVVARSRKRRRVRRVGVGKAQRAHLKKRAR